MTGDRSPGSIDDALRGRVREALARRFGVDARALAAFRIAVGFTLLVDLALRSRDLVAFYTDAGLLPRSALAEQYPALARVSLHAVSGSPRVQVALFLVAAAFALALCIGYRTRIAAPASWLLLASLQARNPHVLNGGDVMLLVVFGLALFLPLGERWSVDALARDRPGRERVADLATAAVLIEIVGIYATNAVLKFRGDRWVRGDAVRQAFELDHYTILLADRLAAYPALLEAVNWLWLGLLSGSVLLVVLTGRRRAALAAAFLGMYAGMAATIAVGRFPMVLTAATLLFVPPCAWDAVERVAAPLARSFPGADRSKRALADLARYRVASTAPAAVRRTTRRLRPVAAGTLLAALVLWNAASVGYVDPPGPTDEVDPEDHEWGMFAPDPSESYSWYAVPAELEDGREVDALGRPTALLDRPPDAAATYPNSRWRRFLVRLDRGDNDRRFVEYACRRAAERYDADVERLSVVRVRQPAAVDAERGPPNETELATGTCE